MKVRLIKPEEAKEYAKLQAEILNCKDDEVNVRVAIHIGECWGAFDDKGRLLGGMTIFKTMDSTFYCDSLFVAESVRRMGVGESLFGCLPERAEFVVTIKDGEEWKREWYGRRGFEIVGKRDFWGNGSDVLLMERKAK